MQYGFPLAQNYYHVIKKAFAKWRQLCSSIKMVTLLSQVQRKTGLCLSFTPYTVDNDILAHSLPHHGIFWHDDGTEIFPALSDPLWGNPPVTGGFPHKGQSADATEQTVINTTVSRVVTEILLRYFPLHGNGNRNLQLSHTAPHLLMICLWIWFKDEVAKIAFWLTRRFDTKFAANKFDFHSCAKHIGVWTKRSPFCWWHSEIWFREWKSLL